MQVVVTGFIPGHLNLHFLGLKCSLDGPDQPVDLVALSRSLIILSSFSPHQPLCHPPMFAAGNSRLLLVGEMPKLAATGSTLLCW